MTERAHTDRSGDGWVVRSSRLEVPLPAGTSARTRTTVARLIDLVDLLVDRVNQLQNALDSRIVIEQAKGVLAERYHVPPETAFEILRRVARNNRTKVSELAAAVAEGREPAQVKKGFAPAARRSA